MKRNLKALQHEKRKQLKIDQVGRAHYSAVRMHRVEPFHENAKLLYTRPTRRRVNSLLKQATMFDDVEDIDIFDEREAVGPIAYLHMNFC
ncbi:hypothetical protein B7Y94_02550 [Candidatus Saccharibacteria bacterium 32-49-12]|nr:MAG: hypothetical protein B7Y94_02550 [Candidatus Saccharibacteria bacterium 32-49-12]